MSSSHRSEMIKNLSAIVVPALRQLNFKGSIPHFRRLTTDRVNLLTFQFDRHGGDFVIEIANAKNAPFGMFSNTNFRYICNAASQKYIAVKEHCCYSSRQNVGTMHGQTTIKNKYIMTKALLFFMTMFAVSTLTSQNAYDKVYQFDIAKENWAKVKLNGKYGFIEKDGKEVVKPIYDDIELFDLNNEGWAQVKLNGKYGFIDKNGNEVVKPIYDRIEQFDINLNGWAQVKLEGKFGFIDKSGKEIVKTVYDKIGRFDIVRDGWAQVKIKKKISFIDKNGVDVLTTAN